MQELIKRLLSTEGDSFWYFASPYSKYPDGIEFAFQEVAKGAGQLIAEGVRLYCPIAHTHPIAIYSGLDPLDHNIWLPADMPFMKLAKGLIVYKMPTWEESYGVSVEIGMFKKQNKPVEYMEYIQESYSYIQDEI